MADPLIATIAVALFACAFALCHAVFIATLLPALPRIVALLRGEWS